MIVLAPAAPGWATHAVDHRYIVLGYVRDSAGRAVVGTPVRVVRRRTGLAYDARTGSDGLYAAIVHLHDDDVGALLDVTAGRVSVRVEARFQPLDHRHPRGTRVDFMPKKGVEEQAAFARTLDVYLRR